jgi:hypothetical protein
MGYLSLSNQHIRTLFLNKYITLQEPVITQKPESGYNSLELYEDAQPINSEAQTFFLSMFEKARLLSENDKAIYSRNYDIPVGFLEIQKKQSNSKFQYETDKSNEEVDNVFLGIRRGFINSFLNSYEGKDNDLKPWFECFNELVITNSLFLKLIQLIIDCKDFPQVEMTTKLAKSTKQELQFIFFGRLLAEVFFPDNNGKTDSDHRDWLMNLNPIRTLEIQEVPSRFKADIALILSYILSVKLSTTKSLSSIDDIEIKQQINEIKGAIPVENETILFYTSFWIGVLKYQLNNFFHTELSNSLLQKFEKKSFFLKNTIDLNIQFSDDEINKWLDFKSKKLTSKDERFRTFCKMHSGIIPKERTEAQILEKIHPFNLSTKSVLIQFFKDERALRNLKSILDGMPFLRHVLLVFKQEASPNNKETFLEKDLILSNKKSEFSKEFPQMKFEVISKNTSNDDDRDIINNLKGFLKKHNTENNFIYLSDETIDKNQINRENLWIGTAYSDTPVFNKDENYLFINS